MTHAPACPQPTVPCDQGEQWLPVGQEHTAVSANVPGCGSLGCTEMRRCPMQEHSDRIQHQHTHTNRPRHPRPSTETRSNTAHLLTDLPLRCEETISQLVHSHVPSNTSLREGRGGGRHSWPVLAEALSPDCYTSSSGGRASLPLLLDSSETCSCYYSSLAQHLKPSTASGSW